MATADSNLPSQFSKENSVGRQERVGAPDPAWTATVALKK